jgi:CMP/dCMP kinase
MPEKPKIVAVDGPAGSGKSSICSKVATKLGWTYVNTGALYRVVGLLLERCDIDTNDEQQLSEFLDQITPAIHWVPESKKLIYNDEDITAELYSVTASRGASKVAKMPMVRAKLLPLQRRMTLQSPMGALVDGRDIGTVVFPDADLKIFMTASIEERARRRYSQMMESAKKLGKPLDQTIEQVELDIKERDDRDSARGTAPLKKADDAVLFDNSGLTMDEAVERMVELIKKT